MGVRDPRLHWFLTYPQNDATPDELLTALKNKFTVKQYLICRENHKDGNPHLHAYIELETGVRTKDAPIDFNLLSKTGNYQPCRSCQNVIKYVKKGNDYLCSFDLDKYKAKKGKVTSQTLRTHTALEALDEGLISINSIRAFEHARSLAVLPITREGTCGIWITGPPGVGKSRVVRDLISSVDLFTKHQNKWWDGYVGQKYVLVDDLDDEFCSWHNLKLWTDRYPTTGEIKGGNVSLCYSYFLVTSNYTLSELISKKTKKRKRYNEEENEEDDSDSKLLSALKRRFVTFHLPGKDAYDDLKRRLKTHMQFTANKD